jgi:hypothetical protein
MRELWGWWLDGGWWIGVVVAGAALVGLVLLAAFKDPK